MTETRCPFHPGRKSAPDGILCPPCKADLEDRDPPLKGLPVKRRRVVDIEGEPWSTGYALGIADFDIFGRSNWGDDD